MLSSCFCPSVRPSVRPSVCLSPAGTVPMAERMITETTLYDSPAATLVFCCQRSQRNSDVERGHSFMQPSIREYDV